MLDYNILYYTILHSTILYYTILLGKANAGEVEKTFTAIKQVIIDLLRI